MIFVWRKVFLSRFGISLWFGLLIVAVLMAGSALAGSSPVIPAKGGSPLQTGIEAINYSLSLDVDSAYPGDVFSYQIYLENLEAVASFDLLINYDPSVLSVIGLTTEQTRAADFEYFTYSYDADNVPGNIRISGIADEPGDSIVSPMPAGSGAVAEIEFQVAGNIAFQGYMVPVRFVFPGDLGGKDNTLTDASGTRIETSSINYTNGSVQILKIGDINIGDINLNGLDFEISDAIYFSNFYMNPYQYPLNPLQMANSDINGDYMAATIADLVALINVIVNSGSSALRITDNDAPVATFSYETSDINTLLSYETSTDVGGLLISIVTDQPIDPATVSINDADMSVAVGRIGNESRILVYSFDGHTLPSGKQAFLSIDGLTEFTISSVSMSSADGRLVDISLVRKEVVLPEKVTLFQNYPNPFNPETRIDFSLPETARVRLAVFNLLGREVNVLIDDVVPAGVHSSVWDGSDQSGRAVASGVYYYRLESKFENVSRKMVLLK